MCSLVLLSNEIHNNLVVCRLWNLRPTLFTCVASLWLQFVLKVNCVCQIYFYCL